MDDLAALVERLRKFATADGAQYPEEKDAEEAAAAIESLSSAREVQDAALSCLRNDFQECALRAERAELECESLAAENARLTKLETEVWSNPEMWTQWCDIRMLERAERAEAERDAYRQLLREAIDGDHVYGNDSEQWLVRAEAALKERK